MIDKEMIIGLRKTFYTITAILMFITVVLQIVAYNALRQGILCVCILLLLIIELILDIILKDNKKISACCCWLFLWIFNLIITSFLV